MRAPIQALKSIGFICLLLCLGGCALFRGSGWIKNGNSSVSAVKDAGKPATLSSDTKVNTLTLPAGTTVTTTKLEAVASIPATSSSAAIPFQPQREITTFTVPKAVKWDRSETSFNANTGVVDTSIAEKKIDSQESRPLLYASLVSAIVAGFFVYRAYPTPALISAASAIAFFLAWKVSGMPDWFWSVGAIGVAGGVFLYLGHERGLNSTSTSNTSVVNPPAIK